LHQLHDPDRVTALLKPLVLDQVILCVSAPGNSDDGDANRSDSVVEVTHIGSTSTDSGISRGFIEFLQVMGLGVPPRLPSWK
jgi:hypothetical protein